MKILYIYNLIYIIIIKIMLLPPISDEQHDVVNSIGKINNVIVESVAGSGKTTCNIYIAKSYPTKSILLLTYNAKLKMETRERVNMLNITNIETHSYHSFCVKYYNKKCFTDYQIINIIKSNTIQIKKFKYDLIILDEAQDISPLYHQLICKIFVDNFNLNCQICLLGDRAQSIYDFNRADSRFIIYADIIFNFNNLPWIRCTLSESYRVTKETANFINNCMGTKFAIKSSKITGNKPKYLITDSFSNSVFSKQYIELKNYLKNYKPDEIFILAPSVKNDKSPVRQLENLIKNNLKNVQVYVPISDEEKLDEQILNNKLVFSTFHQAKGLERKVVFVYGFDDSYFKFFKKDKNPKVCPNELYVATTRALEHLVVIHGKTNGYLPFINKNLLNKYATIIKSDELQVQKYQVTKTIEISVTDLIKHLPVDILNNCIEYLTITNIRNKSDKILIPYKSQQSNGYESLGEITGIAIPSYLQYKTSGTMSIYNESLHYSRENDITNESNTKSPEFLDSESEKLNEIKISSNKYDLELINLEKLKPDELLYIANYYNTIKTGFLYKKFQITNYNWLSQENLNLAYDRLSQLGISKKAKYEQYFGISKNPEQLDKRLIGFIDCIDESNIYEFKCVEKLENEHYLQLAIYMYLYENTIKDQSELLKADNIISNYKSNNSSLVSDILTYIDVNNKKIEKELNVKEKERLEEVNNRLKIQMSRQLKDLNKQTNTLTLDIKSEEKIQSNNYYLYNILTDEMEQVSCSHEKLKEMIQYLFHAKYISSKEISDDIFLQKIVDELNKYKQFFNIKNESKLPVEKEDKSNLSVEKEDKSNLSVEKEDKSNLSVEKEDKSNLSVEQKDKSNLSVKKKDKSNLSVKKKDKSNLSVEKKDKNVKKCN